MNWQSSSGNYVTFLFPYSDNVIMHVVHEFNVSRYLVDYFYAVVYVVDSINPSRLDAMAISDSISGANLVPGRDDSLMA